MRKKHYRIAPIPKGEDTPCKSECDVYWLDNFECSGNCKLVKRWRFIPKSVTVTVRGEEHTINYHQIKGYIYKKI